MNIHYLWITFCLLLCSGCSAIRTVEDTVSTTLEPIPLFKFMGVESRKSQEEAIKKIKEAKDIPKLTPLPLPPEKVEVSVKLNADLWLNPNSDQQAAPLQIRIFYLDKADKFLSSGALSLIKNPGQVLGQDMRQFEDIQLIPGEQKIQTLQLPVKTYVGLMANFRTEIAPGDQSRVVMMTKIKHQQVMEVRFVGTTIEILSEKENNAVITSK